MKKKFIYFVILFSAIVLQTSVLPLIFHGRPVGDLVLMFVLAGAVLDGFAAFLWWAVFAGAVYDFATYTTVGLHSLIFLLVVYSVSFFSRRLSVEFKGVGLALLILFVAASSVISQIILGWQTIFEVQKAHGFFGPLGGLGVFGLEISYNTILFFVCFAILKKTKSFFTIE
jgi:rod shape-determining protein MreD